MTLTTTHRSLALAFGSGLLVFLYGMADTVGKLQDWSILYEPPTVGRMLFYAAGGLGAMLAALKLDTGEMKIGQLFGRPPS